MLYDAAIFEEITLLGEVLAAVAEAVEPIPVVELDRVLAREYVPGIEEELAET